MGVWEGEKEVRSVLCVEIKYEGSNTRISMSSGGNHRASGTRNRRTCCSREDWTASVYTRILGKSRAAIRHLLCQAARNITQRFAAAASAAAAAALSAQFHIS